MSAGNLNGRDDDGNSFYAAMARTATRGVALYFSRPVRLFRPSKVSGWQILNGLASQHGQSLTPQYVSNLVQKQGFMVIPKHFVPPMIVNLALGSVLWATYGEAVSTLNSQISSPLLVSALSGGIAGGTQAVLAAPAENVRFWLEGGNPVNGWSHAWKEVFRGSDGSSTLPKETQLREAKQVKVWMKEVGEMAGRGWNGWGWGVAKDTCGTSLLLWTCELMSSLKDLRLGFAVFFAIFELTRRAAGSAKIAVEAHMQDEERRGNVIHTNVPRIAHAFTLVSGGACAGLAYEMACRPWDNARKAVHVHQVTRPSEHHSALMILLRKLKDEGLVSFFQNLSPATHEEPSSALRRRARSFLRTLARVGPWGVGFLVWESFGPGIS
ncbi:hypothetical protein BXZ70DRAFT_885058 [Cristinia sonorae]|uniref:Mitochondrial carrier protein n=1 Tax=Cristinia sonorae TaxID=1940300 RepID=A0A8K0UX43_9AGAR|nr:hypothetical protein BXZ70DRAFT_885058 [Cristinia sonorae]